MPLSEEEHKGLIKTGLNLISQALSIFDSDLKLAVCNRRYQDMFDFPDAFVSPGVSFEETIRYLVLRGEYGSVDDAEEAVRTRVKAAQAFVPHYLERMRPNGRWVSVEGFPLPQGGWVTVYTDITEVRIQQQMLRTRSAELSEQLLSNTERLSETNRALSAANTALEAAKNQLAEMEARIRLTTEMIPRTLPMSIAIFATPIPTDVSHRSFPGAPRRSSGSRGAMCWAKAHLPRSNPISSARWRVFPPFANSRTTTRAGEFEQPLLRIEMMTGQFMASTFCRRTLLRRARRVPRLRRRASGNLPHS